MPTRRATLIGALALSACGASTMGASSEETAAEPALAAIEARLGGARLGVAVLDTGGGQWLANRPRERFAMCSTFKLPLVANVLWNSTHAGAQLRDSVRFSRKDLLDYAPVTRAHVGEGSLTVEQLCEAAITLSDNTAANLLLGSVMGPEGLTNFLRAHGDSVTRLDRTEPTLNENAPGDERDTTTPEAMVRTMREMLLGDTLTPALREKLIGWMVACQTGQERLRAGLPADWRVGDKTGTGANGAHNDIAIALPPGRAPILIASYISDGSANDDARDAAHADVAHVVARAFS
ncbi:MAG TPA: class A beta-lactamase [Caulobacterales bacterium]|nr:class A beta-lactamase [Caulobacterales bacterium]